MTTSQTLYHTLLALSQKAKRKKKEERKPKVKNTAKIVELTRTVMHRSSHHEVILANINRARQSQIQPIKEETHETSVDKDPTDAKEIPIYDSYYPQRKHRILEEMEHVEQRRQEAVQKQVEFWDVYKYGLEKIANLNDLRDAPDAIMPGNFPQPPSPPEDGDVDDDNQKEEKANATDNNQQDKADGIVAGKQETEEVEVTTDI